tara:strand:+ start:419 stop:943 length:525 start_codon:yes stop_codon:yes gene_type:complete
MQIETSWMLPLPIFEWIEENIPFGSTILEFGSGEGSKRLSVNYDLYSIEHNPEWLGFSQSTYIYAPIKLSDKYQGEIGWYDIERIKEYLPSKIDLMIIDGPNGSIGRSGLLDHVDSFSWEFPVIIDDLHREKEYAFSQHLSEKCNLQCTHYSKSDEEISSNNRSFGVFLRKEKV